MERLVGIILFAVLAACARAQTPVQMWLLNGSSAWTPLTGTGSGAAVSPTGVVYMYCLNGTAWTPATTTGNCFSGFTPGGAAGGDLSGSYPSPTVAKITGYSALFKGTPGASFFTDANITATANVLSSTSQQTFTSAMNGWAATVYAGSEGVGGATYTSGITTTGSTIQTCLFTFTGGGGSGATGYVYLTGANTVAANSQVWMLTNGTSYTSAPTAATASPGGPSPASACSGTVTVASLLQPAVVNACIQYASASTVNLLTFTSPGVCSATPVNATTTVSAGYAAIGPDSTAAWNSCGSAANAAGGGYCWIPYGSFKLGAAGTAPVVYSNVNYVGVGPQWTAPANLNPDGSFSVGSGSWFDLSGGGITGNTLRNTNLKLMGFYDSGSSALTFGSNNQDGISESALQDLTFVGPATYMPGVSDTAITMYNFQHIAGDRLYAIWYNTLTNLINQSQYIQGGNSTFRDNYVHTYIKSVANTNTGEPGLGFYTFCPSSGTALPLNYILEDHPQVDGYFGDNTGALVRAHGTICSATDYTTQSIDIKNADLEGTYADAMDVQHCYYCNLDVFGLNSQNGSSIIFHENDGIVYGNQFNCRSNGGACTTTRWSTPGYAVGVMKNLTQQGGYFYGVDNATNNAAIKTVESVVANNVNNGYLQRTSVGVSTTLSTGGTTTNVFLMPANSCLVDVNWRVATTITTATNWELGISGTPALSCAQNANLTAGNTGVCSGNIKTNLAANCFTAATQLITTTTGTPGAGVIHFDLTYELSTPPTN